MSTAVATFTSARASATPAALARIVVVPFATAVTGIVTFANAAALVFLIHYLLTAGSSVHGKELLLAGAEIWWTNVIVFALWFWELDRGGPRAREHRRGEPPDFLFPQMTDAKELMPDWQPAFSDYLYTASTNAMYAHSAINGFHGLA